MQMMIGNRQQKRRELVAQQFIDLTSQPETFDMLQTTATTRGAERSDIDDESDSGDDTSESLTRATTTTSI